MKYKVLDNRTAVLVDRQPEVVREKLNLEFVDAPAGATAVLVLAGFTIYRPLVDGACEVPVDKLNGKVKVFVALLGGDTTTRYTCEDLKVEKLSDGGTLVSPNDMDLPLEVAALRVENEELRKEQRELSLRLEAVEKQLDKLTKGYALI